MWPRPDLVAVTVVGALVLSSATAVAESSWIVPRTPDGRLGALGAGLSPDFRGRFSAPR